MESKYDELKTRFNAYDDIKIAISTLNDERCNEFLEKIEFRKRRKQKKEKSEEDRAKQRTDKEERKNARHCDRQKHRFSQIIGVGGGVLYHSNDLNEDVVERSLELEKKMLFIVTQEDIVKWKKKHFKTLLEILIFYACKRRI